jgi:hypothetical protein
VTHHSLESKALVLLNKCKSFRFGLLHGSKLARVLGLWRFFGTVGGLQTLCNVIRVDIALRKSLGFTDLLCDGRLTGAIGPTKNNDGKICHLAPLAL